MDVYFTQHVICSVVAVTVGLWRILFHREEPGIKPPPHRWPQPQGLQAPSFSKRPAWGQVVAVTWLSAPSSVLRVGYFQQFFSKLLKEARVSDSSQTPPCCTRHRTVEPLSSICVHLNVQMGLLKYSIQPNWPHLKRGQMGKWWWRRPVSN